jgi:hypothetical protein
LNDFFQKEVLEEVEDFCERLLPLFTKAYAEKKELPDFNLTPRKCRGIILAVFRSLGRKRGQKFSKHLLEEINKRFNYKRCITLFEVATWENELVELNYLKRPEDTKKLALKSFLTNVMKHLNFFREKFKEDKDKLALLQTVRKDIFGFAKSKELQEKLYNFIEFKSDDFAARMTIWLFLKHHTREGEYHTLKYPKATPWRELFLLENEKNGQKHQKPIRSWKYIHWIQFRHKNELMELGLFPEEEVRLSC